MVVRQYGQQNGRIAVWQYGRKAEWQLVRQHGRMVVQECTEWQYGNMAVWQYGSMAVQQNVSMAVEVQNINYADLYKKLKKITISGMLIKYLNTVNNILPRPPNKQMLEN